MSSALIGHDAARDVLADAITSATEGRGSLVLFSGGPGMGKTALAEHGAREGRAAGLIPCWGRPWEEGGAPDLWPWTQALRALAAAAPSGWPTRGGALLATLLPELDDAAGSPPPSVGPRGTSVRLASEPGSRVDFALFDAVRMALAELPRTAAPLLVLEDLHAADVSSLQLLRLLAKELRSLPTCIIATYQPLSAKQRPEVDRLIAGIAREGRMLTLQGLDVTGTRDLLTRLRGRPVPARLASRVHDATAGNPAWISLLADEPQPGENDADGRDASLILPVELRRLVRHRLDHLEDRARAVLSPAAVLGRELDVARLRAVLDDTDRDALLADLGACVRTGVLAEVPDRPGRYRFVHGVVHQAIEEEIPPVDRAALHLRAAEAIERLHARDVEPHLDELARHYRAGNPDDVGRALQVSVRAAERAMEAMRLDHAAVLWRGAVSLAERSGADRLTRCDLLLRQGDAETRSGANSAARATFIEATRVARDADDALRFARAVLGCGGSATTPTAGVVDGTLVDLLREAIDRLDKLGSAATDESGPAVRTLAGTRAALLGRLAMERYYVDPLSVRDTLTREAVDLAHRSGDRATLGRALNARHYALWSLEDVEERLANATRILEVAREANDPELALQARTWRLVASLELGDAPAVDREIAVHDRIAQSLGMPYHRWNTLVFRGMRALLEGRFVDARRHAEAALEIGEQQDVDDVGTSMGPNARMMYGVQLFNLHREQGRLAELDETITSFSRTYPNLPVWRCALALTRLQQGRVPEAREQVEHLGAENFAQLPMDGNWLIAVTLLAEVVVGLGDTARAKVLYGLLAPHEARVVVVAQGASCRGSVTHYLGLLSATVGDHASAVGHLRRAVAVHEGLGARPYAVRSRLALAASLDALGGSADEVAKLVREGRAVAAELGMAEADPLRVAERAEWAESSGHAVPAGRDPTAPPAAGGPPHAIARMVRDGNRWTVAFEGRVTNLRDAKGLHYLARLLAEPDLDHPAVVLERGPGAGPLDRAAARDRFDELRADLAEAERAGEADSALRTREQMRALADELTGADAAADGRGEQSRVNVTRAIRTAMRKLTAADPALAEHLERAIRTGASCTYRPDPRAPITWLVDAGAEASA